MPGRAPAEFTLDELAARSGVTARNIRFYTGRGMLSAPTRRGRTAHYTADHLVRLELIRELQAHGFTLSAIETYLARVPADASPETIALHRTLLAPWMAEQPESLSMAELSARAGRDLSPQDVGILEDLGIVRRAGRRYDVSVAHLSIGVSILTLGLPAAAARQAKDIFDAHGRAIAEELTEVFRDIVWPAYRDGGVDADDLRETVERFKPLTIAALIRSYESAVNDTKRDAALKRAAAETHDAGA
ncbi:MerR family transcriptional regulator [Flexivirga sp. B27]